MIDLLGFWGNVTFLVTVILSPIVLFIMPYVAGHFVGAVTGSLHKGRDAENFFWDNNDGRGDYSYVFGYTVHDFYLGSAFCGGVFSWFILTACHLGPKINLSPVEVVSNISGFLAPTTGWLVLSLMFYFVAIFILRRAYQTYMKIEKAISKVNE